MEQLLLNRKTVRKRKAIKKIQRNSFRTYGKMKSDIAKARIGKLASLQEVIVDNETEGTICNMETKELLLQALRDNKLTGMSGSDFPTADKIECMLNSNEDTRLLIVNAAECEPGLLHDEWLLANRYEEIIKGMLILNEALKLHKAVLAYKVNMVKEEARVALCRIPARFPIGEEHVLIEQITGDKMMPDELPGNHGILVLNVQTVYQIYRIWKGTYEQGRYVTLMDLDDGTGIVTYVKEGTDVKSVMMKHFPQKAEQAIYVGHGIMAAHEMTMPEQFTSAIPFAAVGTPAMISNEHSCRGCGRCVKFCPAGVNVKEVVKRFEKDVQANVEDLGTEKCLHCNNCTFICKAEKNIMAYLMADQ